MMPSGLISSFKIAELFNKSHSYIVCDIKKMLEDLSLKTSTFQSWDNDSYNLPKREFLILISQYPIDIRVKAIDFFLKFELEDKNKDTFNEKKDRINNLVNIILNLEGKINSYNLKISSKKHWDIYTNDLVMITVDHIIPKSKGGTEYLSNKQPMCYYCNSQKSDSII